MEIDVLTVVVFGVGAYIIGSLPTAVWYGQAFHGVDVRDYGSGNAGATNTYRVLGSKASVLVLFIDVFKGWTATLLSFILIHNSNIHEKYIPLYGMLFGGLAIVGHIFPILANFKGGKGVATSIGVVFSINPELALLCLAIFLFVFFATKFVSLGSIIAAFFYPILLLFPRYLPEQHFMVIIGFMMFALVVIVHQENIMRLLQGNEKKIDLFKKSRD
jgi:glycerol-3-phosphate acyltransferase PlsY